MKKVVFGLLLSTFALLGFAGCKQDAKMKAYFQENEFILSVDDEIDFYDHVEVKGLKKEDLSFVSSNEEVLSVTEDGFLAKSSGQSYLLAKYKTNTLASVKVVVKYRFASPKNFSLSQNDGVLTWDNSYTVIEGQRIYADQYEVQFMDVTDGDYGKEFEKTTVDENKFEIENHGSYLIKVKALSNSKYIDDSFISNNYYAIYNAMGFVQNLELEYKNGFNGVVTLSWDEKENALYDVYVNDAKVLSDFEENYFNYDFAPFADLADVKIEIDSKDSTQEKSNTKTRFYVTKFETPTVEYRYQNQDGFLSWNSTSQMGYTVFSQNQENGVEGNNNFEILQNFDAGVNNVTIVANGGAYNSNYYVSSNPSEILKVAKLEKPVVDITFDGAIAKFTFESNEYIKNYKIQIAGNKFFANTEQSLEYTIDVSELSFMEGRYTFVVTSLPSAYPNGTVVPFEMDGDKPIYPVNSDDYVYEFYILSEITDLTHILNNDGDSVLTFTDVQYANNYQVFINGEEISDFENSVEDDLRTIIIPSLKNIAPANDKYEITIVARRLQEEFEKSTVSSATKTLTILSPVSEGDYENGSFAWVDEQNLGQYKYFVYLTDGDFEIDGEPIVSSLTTDTQITDSLEFGHYYVIKVVTVSNDNDAYLDSDFYSDTNILEVDLTVTQQIETPQASLINDNGVYKLSIIPVEFGGEYKVYVDNENDGSCERGDQATIYTFANQFAVDGTYSVEVVASCGSFDQNLYLDSESKLISVTRLPASEFVVEEGYGGKLIKNKEWLTATPSENAVRVDILYNNTVISENNKVDLFGYGDAFDLTFINKAKSSQGDNYYLDSIEKTVSFERASSPTNIKYESGDIKFNNQDEVEAYYLTIKAISNDDGQVSVGLMIDQTHFTVTGNVYTIGMQDLLALIEDSSFQSILRDVTQIDLTIASYANNYDQENNTYHISSHNGSTIIGTNVLSVQKLPSPTIAFSKATNQISWNAAVGGSVYDIYVSEILRKNGYTTNAINILDLVSEEELLNGVYINVVSKNSSYLNSDVSNQIYIKKLAQIQNVRILSVGEASVNSNWIVSADILQDASHVKNVLVNGSANHVEFGQNAFSFRPSDFASDITIQLESYDSEGSNYYLDSEISSTKIVSLESNIFGLNITNGKVIFDNIYDNVGQYSVDENPIIYMLNVTDESGITYHTTLPTGQYSVFLSDLETLLDVRLLGTITITVTAVVKDYQTSIMATNTKCCYGQRNSSTGTTRKLQAISNPVVNIEDSSDVSELDKKLNAYVVLSWADLWSGLSLSNINFNIVISDNNSVLNDKEFTVKADTTTTNYKCELNSDTYSLTLNKNMLQSNSNTLSIVVAQAVSVSSEVSQTIIERCDKNNVTFNVTDEGVLTINSDQDRYKYVAQISIEDLVVEEELENNSQLNLLQNGFFNGKFGEYTIKIIPYDKTTNAEYLPAYNYEEISGTKLEGIENLTIDETGRIVIELYPGDNSHLRWFVKEEGQNTKFTFTPILDQDDGKYYYQVISLVEQFGLTDEGEYNFEITLKKEGSINCDAYSFEFIYKPTENNQTCILAKTRSYDSYIKFNKFDDIDTTGFRLKFDDSQEIKEIYFDANETHGYWITSESGEYFAKEQEIGATSVECYAISLDELLKDYEQGNFTIYISRFGNSSGTPVQFNLVSFSQIQKLNATELKGIKDNFATWSNVSGQGYFVELTDTDIEPSRVSQVKTFNTSLDLRTGDVALTPNHNYEIRVIAFSSVDKVVKSNKSTPQTTKRFADLSGVGLVCKDGKIMFNEENLISTVLFQTINDFLIKFTNQEEYDSPLATILKNNMAIYSPFFTNISNIYDAAVKIKLTKTDNSASYEMTVSVINLIPDFNYIYSVVEGETSFINKLNEYCGTRPNTGNDIDLKKFLQMLKNSSHGIGDGKLIFDDLGNQIPAGNYNVTIYRCNDFADATTGDNLQTLNIDSVESGVQISNLTITASVQSEVSYSNREYFLSLRLGENSIQKYKMILREDIGKKNTNYKFSEITPIEYLLEKVDENNWKLSYGENDISEVIDYIVENGEKIIKVNLTQLRIKTNTNEEKINTNTDYQVDVYAYLGDGAGVINGKSTTVFLNYLKLNVADGGLVVAGGKLIIKPGTSEGSILVKADGIETRTFDIVNDQVEIDFENPGIYSNVIISLNGSISGDKVNIESDTYLIDNIYKLSNPNFVVADGVLQIQQGNNYSSYLSEYVISTDTGCCYSVVYKTDENSVISPSEAYQGATQFYVYAKGSKIDEIEETDIEKLNNGRANYKINLRSNKIILNSPENSIDIKFLDSVAVSIDNGQIEWEDQGTGETFVSDSGEAKAIYRVKIEYYSKDIDNKYEYKAEEIIYTENTYLMTENISENAEYNAYKITVSRLAAIATEQTIGSITTLEGNKFLLSSSTTKIYCLLNDNNHYALRSIETYIPDDPDDVLLRANSPEKVYDNLTFNGKAVFKVEQAVFAQAQQLAVFVEKEDVTGNLLRKQIYGTFESQLKDGYYNITFTPNDKEIDYNNPFTLKIYVSATGYLYSKPLVVSDIYKLRPVNTSDLEFSLSESVNGNVSTFVDFANYFDNSGISGSNNIYNIIVSAKVENNEVETKTLTNSDTQIQLVSNWTSLKIQVVDVQTLNTSPFRLLLNSDTVEFAINNTSNEGLTISWDENDQKFVWDSNDEDTYEFYYSLKVGSDTETGYTQNLYYLPQNMGSIDSFYLRMKKIDSETIYKFSDKVEFYKGGQSYESHLFASGNGTQENPYQISTTEQFLNIAKRNQQGSKIYFKLANNLQINLADLTREKYALATDVTELNFLNYYVFEECLGDYDSTKTYYKFIDNEPVLVDIQGFNQGEKYYIRLKLDEFDETKDFYEIVEYFNIFESFYGELDGNNKVLTIVYGENLFDCDSYKRAMPGVGDITFTKYASLFKTIESTAKVKNLTLRLDSISNTHLDGTNILYSGIALYNYGEITGVEINSVSVSTFTGNQKNFVVISGIASINGGTINECYDRSSVSLTVPQNIDLNFAYSSMSTFNLPAGRIKNCQNTGNKSINIKSNGVSAYVGGICLVNGGTISLCGNDGNFEVNAINSVQSFNAYLAGITISSSGNLQFVYNNGEFEKKTSAGTLYAGGVVYSISGGRINTIVNTTQTTLVSQCSTRPTHSGTNYANVNTCNNITSSVLAQVAVDANSDYELRISLIDEKYVASIARKS